MMVHVLQWFFDKLIIKILIMLFVGNDDNLNSFFSYLIVVVDKPVSSKLLNNVSFS